MLSSWNDAFDGQALRSLFSALLLTCFITLLLDGRLSLVCCLKLPRESALSWNQ